MMKTALSIIQSLRYRLNLSAPSTLVSITDTDELQMLHLLYAVCEELRQARCWTQLKRSYNFNTVSTTASYQLPQDFYAPLLQTQVNDDEDERLIGPVGDAYFNDLLYLGSASSRNYTYRVFGRDENTASGGGQMVLSPTPSAVDTVRFDYITRSFLLPRNWAASTSYTASSYVNASGNIYLKASAGTETSGATVPSHTTGTVTDGTITWTYVSTAYETIIADTDLVVFDDDLVKLGLRAKWLEEHGGEYAQAKAEFESKIDQAVARYRGSYIGNSCAKDASPRYTVQYKSWSFP